MFDFDHGYSALITSYGFTRAIIHPANALPITAIKSAAARPYAKMLQPMFTLTFLTVLAKLVLLRWKKPPVAARPPKFVRNVPPPGPPKGLAVVADELDEVIFDETNMFVTGLPPAWCA